MPLLLYSPKRKQLQAAIGNIILQFKFDGGSGSSILERVSKVNYNMPALSAGTAVWDNSSGQIGIRKAAVNTVYSDAMKLSGSLTLTGDHTVSVWFKCATWSSSANGGSCDLFKIGTFNCGCKLYRDGYSIDGRIYDQGDYTESTAFKYPGGPMPAMPNITNVIWSRSGNTVTVYVDGQYLTSFTTSAMSPTGKFIMLDEMRYMSNKFVLYSTTVFNKALSDTECLALKNLGSNYAV